MVTVAGLATARGFASGPVYLYRSDSEILIPEYLVEPGREEDEFLRLRRAHAETKRDLENLTAVLKERSGRDDVMVFECHLMILEDPLLFKETERHVREGRLNAEAAVRKTAAGARAQFERMNDPYFRERVRDLDDVERRLLKALVGYTGSPHLDLNTPAIIVADDLTPSETVQLPSEFVLGFATDGGSATSHVALLARAMGIPAVTGLGNITSKVRPGEKILLDGTNGAVTLSPDAETVARFEDLVSRQRRIAAEITAGPPAGTLKDGGDVPILVNLHPGVPVAGLKEAGVRGVGLYRSEYLWMQSEGEPSEEEQFETYRDAVKFTASLAADAEICIRALDVGGDKLVRGMSRKEANPFLGNRSIRYLLSNRDTMRTQLRALLRASAFGHAKLMYPMVSCIEELEEAAAVLQTVKEDLDREGIAYDRALPVGMMVEVPAAAVNARQFARHVDFFSIGTNDLVQYTMAADRGNDAVAHLYQPLNPAVLSLVSNVVEAAHAAGIKVGVCGESASDPVVGTLWAAMGVDNLSMSVNYIPAIAKVLASLTRADLDEYAALAGSLAGERTAAGIYSACDAWLRAKIPDLAEMLI
jgi:phosphotransferase system enzyme I (PtsI)